MIRSPVMGSLPTNGTGPLRLTAPWISLVLGASPAQGPKEEAYGDPEIFYKRLHVLELLNCLMEENGCREKTYVSYTNAQVEIAKKAEKILTEDLSSHIPVRQVARQFGVSETSLKNYFRGVYGKNISVYLHDLRMAAAQKALVSTSLPVSEIASEVGYTKQGKFAQVFKNAYGYAPLEYRRMKKLENI